MAQRVVHSSPTPTSPPALPPTRRTPATPHVLWPAAPAPEAAGLPPAQMQAVAQRFVQPWLDAASVATPQARLGVTFATALFSAAQLLAGFTSQVRRLAFYRFLADYCDVVLGTRTLIVSKRAFLCLDPADQEALVDILDRLESQADEKVEDHNESPTHA